MNEEELISHVEHEVAKNILDMMEEKPAGGSWNKVLTAKQVEEVKERYGA